MTPRCLTDGRCGLLTIWYVQDRQCLLSSRRTCLSARCQCVRPVPLSDRWSVTSHPGARTSTTLTGSGCPTHSAACRTQTTTNDVIAPAVMWLTGRFRWNISATDHFSPSASVLCCRLHLPPAVFESYCSRFFLQTFCPDLSLQPFFFSVTLWCDVHRSLVLVRLCYHRFLFTVFLFSTFQLVHHWPLTTVLCLLIFLDTEYILRSFDFVNIFHENLQLTCYVNCTLNSIIVFHFIALLYNCV